MSSVGKNRLYAVFRKAGFDPESGLHYNFFRYYDTETGRYISVDPARSGINFYAYCEANPLNFSDPYGLCPSQGWDWLKQGVVNLLQGLQDTAFDLGNFALTGNDPVRMLDLMLNGPIFESPQWARDKYVGQSDFGYGASKFLTSQGGLILLGAGEAQLLKGMSKLPTSDFITVSRWGRDGLEPGDWVMKGNPSFWNYLKSGKWDPFPWNEFAKPSTGKSYRVPGATVKPPQSEGLAGKVKGCLFDQRQYKP